MIGKGIPRIWGFLARGFWNSSFKYQVIFTCLAGLMLMHPGFSLADYWTFEKGPQEITRPHLQGRASAQGVVLDEATGKPMAGATVSLPDLGIQSQTDQTGFFNLPHVPASPAILNIEKPGFAPKSKVLTGFVSQETPLRFTLKGSTQQTLILDRLLHHLGDNRYSYYSAGAAQFQQDAEGALLEIPFSLKGRPMSQNPTLELGSVIGLDTVEAHQLKQSSVPYYSSPVVVRLNGVEIALIKINGDHQHIALSPRLLKPTGENILEIEAGYHTPGGTRIDYDDMELMNLQLNL
ncbi:MAG: carboxypeptidase-like regulatory domain-containing protein [Cyanobacteria bacterium]|nr:carboxypeptidase-like regulatory domain-containing protein [Cyanobacteriota bacterium]